jgi:glycine/D-amino acid oxidase-like deaminating enzyme
MPRIVVIGAGVIGASVAFRLAEAGADVTVLEAVRPAAGTSSNSFAWVNANDKPPAAYHDLNAAGVEEHHHLAAELAGSWFHPDGNLEIAVDPSHRDELRRRLDRLRSTGYAAESISIDEALARVPDLRLASPAQAEAAYFPREGWIEAPIFVRMLLNKVRRAGGTIVYPATVQRLERSALRITGVLTDSQRYAADIVVDCTGPSAGLLVKSLGLDVARQRSPGLLLVTEPIPMTMSVVLHLDNLHLRPDSGGRLRFGAAELDERIPRDGNLTLESPHSEELVDRAVQEFPTLRTTRIEAVRVGWRAMPGDGFSAVGAVSGLAGYYLVFTHSGITLAPLLGRLVAEEIVEGRRPKLLESFAPDRLVTR